MAEETGAPAGGTGDQGAGSTGQTGGTGDQGTQNTGTGQGQQSGGTGPATGQQNAGQQGATQRVEDLPEWAQKLIKDTRKEAGDARTNAKTTAATEARDALLQQLGKALGFVKDEPLDPAKLAEDLKARDGKLRDTTVQLAVLRAAGKAGGDPDALLDSRSFLDSLTSLDPGAEGFAGQVSAAIAAAVKDNPRLGVGTPITRGGGEITGGTQEVPPGPLTDAQADELARKSRNRFGGGATR